MESQFFHIRGLPLSSSPHHTRKVIKMLQSTRRWFVIILSVFLLASFLASALITVDPDQLLATAAKNSEKLKTVTISAEENMEILSQSMNITMDGVIELPEKAYLKMSTSGQSVQMLMLSQDEVYARMSDSDPWQQVDISSGLDSLGLNVDFLSQQNAFSLYEDPEYLDDEVINGVNCYHLSYTVDFQSYFDKLLTASAADMFTLENVTSGGEIWIGKADMQVHKNSLEASLTMAVTDASYGVQSVDLAIDMIVFYTHFNEPVTIPEP